ncbi:MAG: DUF1501 domain-containing protein [Verrucomicrobiae bacterium]|nr:DUF1501 domain-containing protein [Verrucomicrobiae bacterium]
MKRRAFIRTSAMGLAMAWAVPTFIAKTAGGLHGQTLPASKDGRILVILQMGGGNDGLNTVIPHADDVYYRNRSQLGIGKGQILRLDDYMGLNPKLTELKGLYDAGHLAVINGVGYPNPNRSHFRSMEIWQTASDADRFEYSGWVGRYFDNACKGSADPMVGINFGTQAPQAFDSPGHQGICIANANRYLQAGNSADERGAAGFQENNDGGSIGELTGRAMDPEAEPAALDFLKKTAVDAGATHQQIMEIVRKAPVGGEFPRGALAQSLRLVSLLIAGGVSTKIYYLNQGGYDTHVNQKGTHERLMQEFSQSLGAFCADLKARGVWDRVMIMTFSEFGRRVRENASGGTDHGAAGPMFVTGGGVKPGLYGKYPSLTELNDGDLRYGTDFRSVYATVLDQWLGFDSQIVLKKRFAPLSFV